MSLRGIYKLDRKYGHNIRKVLREEELELLSKLYDHHKKQVLHSFNVASDCVYVAERLGLPLDEIEKLRIAALLHDVGKLDVELLVLDKGVDLTEQQAVARFFHKATNAADLRQVITLREIIEYRSHLPFWRKKRISKRGKKAFLSRLGSEADVTLLEHIRNHVKYTTARLEKAGTDPHIIAIAAGHHPEYSAESRKIKLHTLILSVVDKFNAMIQSEGRRNYIQSTSRAEALDLLLKKFCPDSRVLQALSLKYLPLEAKELEATLALILRTYQEKHLINRGTAEKVLARTAEFLKVNRIFKVVKDISKIKAEEEELEKVYRFAFGRV